MTIYEHSVEEIEKAIKDFDDNRFFPEDISEDSQCIAIDCMRVVLMQKKKEQKDG